MLIDRLLALEPGQRAVATKTFAPGEEFFADHFPGQPVVPGVLVTEAMAQTAGWMLAPQLSPGRWPLLSMIEKAKLRRLVRPGEELRLEAELLSSQPDDFAVRTSACVGDARVAEARLYFHAFETAQLAPGVGEWAAGMFRALGGAQLLADGTGGA